MNHLIINRIIREILLQDNYVVIPQFGAFITNYQASQIDEDKQLILPPNRKISFNASVTDDDGTLVSRIAKEDNTDIKAAQNKIDNWVKKKFSRLNDGKSIYLEKIGQISYNDALKLEFKPEKSRNLNLHSYGMIGVSCEKLNKQEKIENKDKLLFNRKIFMRAAILIPLLLVGFVASYYIVDQPSFEKKTNNLASFFDWNWSSNSKIISKTKTNKTLSSTEDESNKLISKKTTVNNKVKKSTPILIEEPEVIIEAKIENELIEEPTKKIEENNTNPELTSINKQPYLLISGCFSNKTNAKKMLDILKKQDLEGYIMPYKDMYSVVIEQFKSKTQANHAKISLKSKGVETWIYKQK